MNEIVLFFILPEYEMLRLGVCNGLSVTSLLFKYCLKLIINIKIFSPFSIEITTGFKTTKFVTMEISYSLIIIGVY